MFNLHKAQKACKDAEHASLCEVGDQVRDAANRAIGSARVAYQTARDDVAYTKSVIRSRPVRSSLVALAIGYLIGSILG